MSFNSNFTVPYGKLGLIVLESSKELGNKINDCLLKMRSDNLDTDESIIIPIEEVRFSNGEGKVKLKNTVRGKDLYIVCDVGNYNCTYQMYGFTNHKGPDEHFQDIKRVLSAVGGDARRITVIMPLLYAARQHKRKGRESLDCALALQELGRLGVQNIITFDVHDPTVQNAIPLVSFENLYPTYEIVKTFVKQERDSLIDKSKILVISPDTGAMDRSIYYSSVLGLDIGLFYKRRDHSRVVDGKNPIVQHEYIGRNIENQNILIIDDMISSGESIFDVANELKKRKAKKIFVAVTFSLFTEGVQKFKKYYEEGLINKVYSTNLTYIPDEVRNAEWFTEVDMSDYIANVIDYLNYDQSITPLLDATENITTLLKQTMK